MDMLLVTDLVNIDRRRKQLKEELKELEEARKVIEAQVLEEWIQEGINQMQADGRTTYLSSRKWWKAKDGDRQAVVRVLEELDMAEFTTFNTTQLSSFCNELESQEEPIPDALMAVLEVSEDYQVKTRGL